MAERMSEQMTDIQDPWIRDCMWERREREWST